MIRQKIRDFFVNRECVPLVRPLSEEKQLAHIEEQSWSSLRPEFTYFEQLSSDLILIKGKKWTVSYRKYC